jgi:hypothetical protein
VSPSIAPGRRPRDGAGGLRRYRREREREREREIERDSEREREGEREIL